MTYFSRADESDWKYPLPAAPNAAGYLAAHHHRVFWHEYGNPDGEPVLFVHGGPGGGTAPEVTRYFNPDRYRVVLFDQRGCGKSEPHAAVDTQAALTHNTTPHLISDMEALRRHLRMGDKIHLFGGSWGSTLSLAYAIAHPKRVRTLILRGIFLCRKVDLDYFYQGNAAHYANDPLDMRHPGTYQCFPEHWKAFVETIAPAERGDMVKAYARLFAATARTKAEQRQQDKATLAWSVWEGGTSFLAPEPVDAEHFADPVFARAFAQLENHYFMNGAFLGGKGARNRNNNYLLENIRTVARIPVHVVQGQYDQVCPRFGADALVAELRKHKAKVTYTLTPAGHAAPERETMRALTAIMDAL